MNWPALGPAIRPVLVAHCFGCGKRIHSPNEAALKYRTEKHAQNCSALKSMAAQKQARASSEAKT